jgi:hypothetical protein
MAEKHLKNTKKTKEKHVEEKEEVRKGERVRGERRREGLGFLQQYLRF